MASVLAIVPHYGGAWADGRSRPSRLGYLGRSVDSLEGFADRVVVGVQNERDADSVRREYPGLQVLEVDEPEPQFLPAQLCREVGSWDAEPVIYFTEADQVLCRGSRDLTSVVLDDERVYVAPHRLSRVPERLRHFPAIIGTDMRVAPILWHGGVCYAQENHYTEVMEHGPEFYSTVDLGAGYGGAFLCSAALFRRVTFTKTPALPTEHTAGFDLLSTPGVRAVKTRRIFDFYVEHLSGEQFYERLRPPVRDGERWLVQWSDTVEILTDGRGNSTPRARSGS